ncbi:MAG: helix-turn-helix transcriptional regulator [Pseudomonas putida]|jgi:DNA-binding HxlR family transcriptional regulator|nr:helix-turn-helix transcriptional regulator [Pseudomonas putida]
MLDERNNQCPVARALEVIGDRWSLMILRDALDGLRRFSEFQKNLGLAKNILASRLKLLVESGLLEQRPASDGSAYKEYVLTEQGRAVFPVVIGLRQWGERYLFEAGDERSALLDNVTGQPIEQLQVRARDGRALGPEDCHRQRVRHGRVANGHALGSEGSGLA